MTFYDRQVLNVGVNVDVRKLLGIIIMFYHELQ